MHMENILVLVLSTTVRGTRWQNPGDSACSCYFSRKQSREGNANGYNGLQSRKITQYSLQSYQKIIADSKPSLKIESQTYSTICQKYDFPRDIATLKYIPERNSCLKKGQSMYFVIKSSFLFCIHWIRACVLRVCYEVTLDFLLTTLSISINRSVPLQQSQMAGFYLVIYALFSCQCHTAYQDCKSQPILKAFMHSTSLCLLYSHFAFLSEVVEVKEKAFRKPLKVCFHLQNDLE